VLLLKRTNIWIGNSLLILLLTSTQAFAGLFPSPEIMKKVRAAEAACKVELGDESGPRALIKLKKRSLEDSSHLGVPCKTALDEMPAPPNH
jgi:hypothetical protein